MERFYDSMNKRMLYIGKAANPQYWDQHWTGEGLKEQVTRGSGFVIRITKKYVPRGARILEGGCGIGDKVYSLYKEGYDVFGVDYAEETVMRVKQLFPELKIQVADVRELPFENDFFDAYWSLGVIEHFYEGYDLIAKEMHRVLRRGGKLLLTCPVISPLRIYKAKRMLYQEFIESENMIRNFYQFALNSDKVIKDFESIGFKLLEIKPSDGIKGLKDEVMVVKPLLQKVYEGNSLLLKVIRKILDIVLVNWCHHMKLFVFEKEQ